MRDENQRRDAHGDADQLDPEEGERLMQEAWLADKVQLGVLKPPSATWATLPENPGAAKQSRRTTQLSLMTAPPR